MLVYLTRYAANDWAWFFCLVAAAFATYLLPFTQTLNNHTVAAFSAFFALYHVVGIWGHEKNRLAGDSRLRVSSPRSPWRTNCRRWRSWRFCSSCLVVSFPRQTVLCFVPGTLVPIAAFMAAQYAVFGEFKLAYEAFGTDEYLFEGSLWKTPLDLDAFNEHPEPYATYFFHMTSGHHGVFLVDADISVLGLGRRAAARGWRLVSTPPRRTHPWSAIAWLTTR